MRGALVIDLFSSLSCLIQTLVEGENKKKSKFSLKNRNQLSYSVQELLLGSTKDSGWYLSRVDQWEIIIGHYYCLQWRWIEWECMDLMDKKAIDWLNTEFITLIDTDRMNDDDWDMMIIIGRGSNMSLLFHWLID